MEHVYIAIGSNLGKPLKQAKNAIIALNTIPTSKVINVSSTYRTKPLGIQNQSDFLNMVILLETNLKPEILLNYIQKIEFNFGRIRKNERWGPRVLDIDIMLLGNKTINTPRLIIPHYGLKKREFMLYPLSEIAPDLVFPDGELLSKILTNTPRNDLRIWANSI
ncbi:2-amino-4-hydroxy-6-hydroxymethyldihydropteridinepyrophosphokinase [Candidatus Providencia siddallii]|uniref:2-amino-4-hydroxy-6-hydroxymethyldihydropteridine pyrophosphokinase n=1 Tax=Candidatus Providencia siddallii TaxID=1715285 RepID=A0A0M6WAK4_9GAMM|nr:2-amino-4-hydroxy-6-hydroxymethyldihydropteridinepyrophosphokinase [Candidatus Providencia siddallii]